MPTPEERLAALRAGGGVKSKSLLRSVYEKADAPLWEGPQRWGQQFGDWLTEDDEKSIFDSPYQRSMQNVRGATATGSRLAGGIVSGLTSPLSIGTTAATLGAGLPARVGVGAARNLGLAARGAGAAQTAHGGANIYQGLQSGNRGEVGAGILEAGLGAWGMKTPVTPRPGLDAPRTSATGLGTEPRIPGQISPGGPRAPTAPMPTTTYPTATPSELMSQSLGRVSMRPPGMTGRMLPPGTGQTTTAPHYGLPSTPPGLGNVSPLGVVERGTVGPVSAGMTTPGPGQRAFEALVPERYKGASSAVTPEGLSMNVRGELPTPPTPGLPSLGKQGQVVKTPAAKGATTSLEQMVERYGIRGGCFKSKDDSP